jgi:GNAT superfamily N-acetyltransferase
VPSLEIRPLRPTRREVGAFVRFAERVYRDLPQWGPPLVWQQARQVRSGPFTQIGELQLWMAFRGGAPVARLSVHESRPYNAFHGTRQGFFGFFEALDDEEAVRALFAAGERWLRDRGCGSVVGPCSFSVYEEIGMLLDAFGETPVVLCPYNPPYYPRLLEALGYAKEVDWYAYLFTREQPIPERWTRIADRVLRQPDVSMRHPDLREWMRELVLVRDIFNEAWAENWGHVPFSDAEWHELAEGLRLAVKPELCWILSVKERPIGFSVTLPDLNLAVREARGRLLPLGWWKLLRAMRRIRSLRTMAMGVLKPYRGHGYEVAMVVETIRNGVRLGYEKSDCSLVVETNRPMLQLLEALGARRYKTYRVYRKPLQPGAGVP